MADEDTTQGDQSTQTDQETSDTTPEETPTEEAEGWYLSDGVKGDGEIPEWYKADKYKSVADQAKAYKDLESRFGSFTGSPEEFAINLSDNLKEKGIEISKDDPIMEEAFNFAKESNMSQDGFDKMVNIYALSKAAEQEALSNLKADELKLLGDDAQKRLDNLTSWGEKNFDEETLEGFIDMAQSAASIKAMERMIGLTRNAQMNPKGDSSPSVMTKSEVMKMYLAKDENGNRLVSVDKDYKAKYEKIRDEVLGSEPYRVKVG